MAGKILALFLALPHCVCVNVYNIWQGDLKSLWPVYIYTEKERKIERNMTHNSIVLDKFYVYIHCIQKLRHSAFLFGVDSICHYLH